MIRFNTWKPTWVVHSSSHLISQRSPAKTSQTCAQDSTPAFPIWARNCTHRRSCRTEDLNEILAVFHKWSLNHTPKPVPSKTVGEQFVMTHLTQLEDRYQQHMRTAPCLRVQVKNTKRHEKRKMSSKQSLHPVQNRNPEEKTHNTTLLGICQLFCLVSVLTSLIKDPGPYLS